MIVRIVTLLALLLVAPAAFAAELVVTVSGITQPKGVIRVVVISDPDGFARQDASQNLDASGAKDGVLTARFSGLSAGIYGLVALQEKSINHALEKAVTGSVGAPVSTSSEVHVTLVEPKTTITVPLTVAR